MEKKIRVAIVGYGNIGRFTLEALQADPLIAQVPAISRGSVAFLSLDSSLIAASCTPTTLAIEATIDEYLNLLSDAASHLS